MHCKTMVSPFFGRFFLVSKRTIYFFGRGVIRWMLTYWEGQASWAWPSVHFIPGQLSVEFAQCRCMVDQWGDLALDSCAQFLAAAEHRLIPSRARSVCHQLGRAGHHSVWAPACQDRVVLTVRRALVLAGISLLDVLMLLLHLVLVMSLIGGLPSLFSSC